MSKVNAYYLAPYYYNKLSAHILQVEMPCEEDGKKQGDMLTTFPHDLGYVYVSNKTTIPC